MAFPITVVQDAWDRQGGKCAPLKHPTVNISH